MQQWAAPVLGARAPGWAPLRVLSLSPRRWLLAELLLAAAGWGSNEDMLCFRQSFFPVPFPFLSLSFWFMSLDSLIGLVGHSTHRGLGRTGTGPGGSAVRELIWAGSLLRPLRSLGDSPPNPTVVDAFLHVTWLELEGGTIPDGFVRKRAVASGWDWPSSGEHMAMESLECSSDVCL